MDIRELEDFRLDHAVKFHDKLNPALWTEKNELDPEVKSQLMIIAKDFMSELGVSSLKVEDITISGSNAAYSYTPHSDLDLHILVDFNKLPDDKIYQELFQAKKTLYNDTHDIKIHGVPVELYVQDSNQPVVSLGEYSLLKNEWIKIPKKRRANFNQNATKAKYEKLGNLIELALKTKSLERIEKVLNIIKRYRKAGLDSTGEFGPENLAFKALRNMGLIKKLYDYKNSLHSKKLSIENVTEILDKASAAKVYWSQENYMTDAPVSQMYTTYTASAQDKNKNILKYNFYNFPKHDLTAIEFSRAVGPWGDNFSIDNAGDQYTVFSTLIKTIEEYLSKHKTKFILFGAKEPSRAKLYQTFVNRFASKFGYKQISSDSIPKPVSSMILNRGDTPFLLQKVGPQTVHENVKFIEGTNCKNCVWWKKDSEKPVGKDELNKYGGLKPPNKEYIAMSKRVDLVTLPGKDVVKVKGFCYHKDINDWVTERMCCALWDGKGVIRDYKGESPLMENIEKTKSGWKHSGLGHKVNRDTNEYPVYPLPRYSTYKTYNRHREGTYNDILQYMTFILNSYQTIDLPITGNEIAITLANLGNQDPKTELQKLNEKNNLSFKSWDQVYKILKKNRQQEHESNLKETSGYIPSKKEKNDPRFKTALTVDVKPDSIKKNAKAFGWKTTRAGIPPLLRK